MISLDGAAPVWAQRLKTSITQALEDVWTRPIPVFTVSTLPAVSDARWFGRMVRVSDGASGKPTVICTGTHWVYPDGANAV